MAVDGQEQSEEVTEHEAAAPQLDPEALQRRRAALKRVRKFGDPILRSRAREIEQFDEDLGQQAIKMSALMHDAYGIGLAAPQVGIANRLLVYRVEPDSPVNALVNPVVEWSSKDEEIVEEGCLSLPAVHVDVERPIHVRVKAHDTDGTPVTVEASGLEARVIQHEIDHLDGVLILDRTKRDQRRNAMREMRAALEAEAEEAEGSPVIGD